MLKDSGSPCPSQIPVPNSTMKKHVDSPRHLTCAPPSPPSPNVTSQRFSSRRGQRRSSAVNYQPLLQQDLSSYLPPQQPSKHYCSPRNIKPVADNKDFGPFGTVPEQNIKNDVGGDIASMFKRPDYLAAPCILQEKKAQQQACPRAAGGGGIHNTGVIMGGTAWQNDAAPNRCGNVLLRSQLPPTNQPTVVGRCTDGGAMMSNSQRSLRNEDVTRILNKYGRPTRSNTDNKDPDFSSIVNPDAFGKEKYCRDVAGAGQGLQAYWEHQHSLSQDHNAPRRRRNLPAKMVDAISTSDQNAVQLYVNRSACEAAPAYQQQQVRIPQQLSEEIQYPSPPSAFAYKQTTHIFPFKELADGHLLVEPAQIAFESRKLCVLMSDPNNNTTIEFSTNKFGGQVDSTPSKHERILHEVKRAMSIAEMSENNGRFNGLTKEHNSCYSHSKKATEEFENKVLQRLGCAKNADTHVIIGDKIFPCHSLALEVFSSYFDRLNRPPENVQKVHLSEQDVPSDAFPVLMDWIMQSDEGRRSIPKKDNLVSVYIAAKNLGLKDLEMQCVLFLDKKVDATDPDLLTIWNSIKRRRSACPELVRIAASKMAASYREIYESKRFLEMDMDELYMLLSSDDIAIESEMDIYNSAVLWLLHDWKNRKVHTNKMMSTVRFGLLSPLQLTQINLSTEIGKVKNEKDYSQVISYGGVKAMIDDGLAYSILDESYKSQPDELRKWVERTGMKVPAPRAYILQKKLRGGPLILEKISLLEDASQSKLKPSKPAEKTSSYTIVNVDPRPDTPHIDSGPETDHGFHSSTSAPNTGSDNKVSRDRSKSRIPTTVASNSGYRPAPTTATIDKGSKRPETTQNQQLRPNTVVHELSKPKLLKNSSNLLNEDTEKHTRPTSPGK